MKRLSIACAGTFFILALAPFAVFAQSAGEDAKYESRYIVDMPSAGILAKGAFSVNAVWFGGGGIAAALSAAPIENFNMGLSFGGANIIGAGNVVWQGVPGVHLRLRPVDETKFFPAITLGVNTQGRGAFDKSEKRFATLSPGLFLTASKNYTWPLGTIAFHGGINYSFEQPSGNKTPNIFVGLEHSIGGQASLSIEYNANLDDSNKKFLNHKGLLNASLRLVVAGGLTAELQLRDLLKHKNNVSGFTRFIGVEFISGY